MGRGERATTPRLSTTRAMCFPGQANVAVPALPNVVDETVGDEHVNMLARRRTRARPAYLPSSPTVQARPSMSAAHMAARDESARADATVEISRDRFRKHARNHASSVHPELFGDDRTIAGAV